MRTLQNCPHLPKMTSTLRVGGAGKATFLPIVTLISGGGGSTTDFLGLLLTAGIISAPLLVPQPMVGRLGPCKKGCSCSASTGVMNNISIAWCTNEYY